MVTAEPLLLRLVQMNLDVEQVMEDTGLPRFWIESMSEGREDTPISVIQIICEAYNINPNEALRWYQDKDSECLWTRREEEVKRRWDRYKRYWILESRTCKKQCFSLDEKMEAVRMYLSGKSSREVADELEIDRTKVLGWVWKTAQV